MSNKNILMAAARKKGQEKQTHKLSSINFDYMSIFPNCTFWEHHDPVRYIDRVPMDTFSTVKVCLGCKLSRMPIFVEGGDSFERMSEKWDFQAVNNCEGASCKWYNTSKEE